MKYLKDPEVISGLISMLIGTVLLVIYWSIKKG